MVSLDVLLEALHLKALPRAGWVRVGAPRPESVAAHSWGVSWLVLALLPDGMDRGRALAYAVLHDLAEVRTGDVTPADNIPAEEKQRREQEAMASLCRELPSLLTTWQAYEAQADPESRFVRELDRLDMALQALAQHEAGQRGMAEFVESAARVVVHPALRPLLEQVQARVAVDPPAR